MQHCPSAEGMWWCPAPETFEDTHLPRARMLLIVCRLTTAHYRESQPVVSGTGMVRKTSGLLRAILAENIRIFRKEKGLSQEELAEQCGLHRTYIGSVERQERNVTLSTLEAFAATLGVTVPQLLTEREVTGSSGREEANE